MVDCTGISPVTLCNGSLVFFEPDMEWSPCFPDVDVVTIHAWDSVDHSFVTVLVGSLHFGEHVSHGSCSLEYSLHSSAIIYVRILLIVSDIPLTYGKTHSGGLVVSLLSLCSCLLVVFVRACLTIWRGYPFFTNAVSRCCFSSVSVSGSMQILALVARHRMVPSFTARWSLEV